MAEQNEEQVIRIFVETPAGERFEADIPCSTKIGKIAADFFESQKWPSQDHHGRGQRAVVELVNRRNPDDTKRLKSDLDICRSGVRKGDTIRISPEAIAGSVDFRARLIALITDYNDMQALAEQNTAVTFTTNRSQAPDCYEVTFHCTSFVALPPGKYEPSKSNIHKAEIILGAEYPRRAPIVIWRTPIFHPNISQPGGNVCLGVLSERYLPGLGLALLVRMLVEVIQWRNFDAYNAYNREAAIWADNEEHWPYIEAIGGHPLQGPIGQFIKQLENTHQPTIIFKQLSTEP